MNAYIPTQRHMQIDACMDGCTHHIIIAVDKLLLKDDCVDNCLRTEGEIVVGLVITGVNPEVNLG